MNALIEDAKKAAMAVLLHNRVGPFQGLPRTAGWGYPEPYTRDLLISALGILVSGNDELIRSLEKVMETLARNQSTHGQIPSLVHDAGDRGASDTTPLFLLVLGMLRQITGDAALLDEAKVKALRWMDYQVTEDRVFVGQLPTSDWRDEQWVLGYGLYVNSLVHGYQRLLGLDDRAEALRAAANRQDGYGFATPGQPVFAIWFYKVLRDSRCDVLGNSLAILTGLADPDRAREMIAWMEVRCAEMRRCGELALDLPPCLFPFIQPSDPDWHARYETYNQPGHYHNGGVWPFVCGFYIAALVAAGEQEIAELKLGALAGLVRASRIDRGGFGFNEWARADDGRPAGEDWQTWSASMYLYAAACVEQERVLFF